MDFFANSMYSSVAMSSHTLPHKFDGYQLKKMLGQGGMGEVHLALDTLLDRFVAIKFITTRKGDSVARKRFMLEARAFARLQHPNVVSIYRVGEVNGFPYLVSEYVKGQALDTLPCGDMDTQEIIHIAGGIARGLAAAHRRGVIHRDIKPANVMITDDGDAKLLDFGIAKLAESIKNVTGTSEEISDAYGPQQLANTVPNTANIKRHMEALVTQEHLPDEASPDFDRMFDRLFENTPLVELTRPGTAMGTPRYMAPEIWRGKDANFSSDVYSFGALLYYMCSGSPPHNDRTAKEIGKKAVTTNARPLRAAAPSVDKGIAAIVDRCLQRDPANRYANGNEIRLAIAQLTPEMRTSVSPEGNPYRGLHPFEEEHRNLFFGRDSEIRLVLNRLRTDPLAIVVGNSGVGKSSLCKAGIIPRLDSWLKDGREWKTLSMVPGIHPVITMSAILSKLLKKDEQDIETAIHREPANIARMIRASLTDNQGVVLFIDQLEELVTLSTPEESTAIAETMSWLSIPTPGIKLLATIRGDFLSALAAMPQFSEQFSRHLFFLRPLTEERVRETIEGPARAKGVSFEDDQLVNVLVASATETEGALPLLQFTMRELWERRHHNRITHAALHEMGGVAGCLARHATHVLEQLPVDIRDAAKHVLTGLVSPSGTRDRKSERALNPDGSRKTRQAISHLINGRLIVAGESRDGPSYELAHESLIRSWPLLSQWLTLNAETERIRERIHLSAMEWMRLDKDKDLLWSGKHLKQALPIDSAVLDVDSRAFLKASVRQRRIRTWFKAALVIIAPIAFLIIYNSGMRTSTDRTRREDVSRLSRLTTVVSTLETHADTLTTIKMASRRAFETQNVTKGETHWERFVSRKKQLMKRVEQTSSELDHILLTEKDNTQARQLYARLLYLQRLITSDPHRQRDLIETMTLYDPNIRVSDLIEPATVVFVESSSHGTAISNLQLFEILQTDTPIPHVNPMKTRIVVGATIPLSSGNYMAEHTREGHHPLRYPFIAHPQETLTIPLFEAPISRIPDGMVVVPGGRFVFGSTADDDIRKKILNAAPAFERTVDTFLIGKTEVTFAQWIAFLQAQDHSRFVRLVPKIQKSNHEAIPLLTRTESGLDLTVQEDVPPMPRLTANQNDWRSLPVFGISLEQITAYLMWLDTTGRIPGARLCTELEWEYAARGADGRPYPHGNQLLATDANFKATPGNSESIGPAPVGSYPRSRSLHNIDDMSGNLREWTTSSLENGHVLRGGGFNSSALLTRVTARHIVTSDTPAADVGIRVCAPATNYGIQE